MQQTWFNLDDALRILAESVPLVAQGAVKADRDDPALDRSTMDGAAMRAADGSSPRRILGTLFAGDNPERFRVEPGTCVRIMTGAALPIGADAVVPVEQLREQEGCLVPMEVPVAGRWILAKGSQARAGEILLEGGRPLNAARIGLRAQVGESWPELRRIPVGVAATGDELAPCPAPYQIRDSNGPMLTSLVHALGADARPLPALPDQPDALADFLRNLGALQILVTAGGVSMGEKDHLPGVLRELGAEVIFQKVRLKPGKPTLAARLDGRILLCLPGNPVSAYLNALLFLPVVLSRLEGRTLPDPWKTGHLKRSVSNPGERPLLHPCRRDGRDLIPLDSRGSADLTRLAQADVVAWIPEGGMNEGDTRYLDLP